jgi:hypothetical protein
MDGGSDYAPVSQREAAARPRDGRALELTLRTEIPREGMTTKQIYWSMLGWVLGIIAALGAVRFLLAD